MQSELCLPVLNGFENLFKSKKNYDVIIQAGEGNNQKEIYAHSMVLCCQSNYFDTAFSTNLNEKTDGKYIFKKPNILPDILESIIRYLYCGQINLSIKNGQNILKILAAADEFGLNSLSKYIQEFLIKNRKGFLLNDPVGNLRIAFQHKAFTVLKDRCLETICYEPNILFGTDKILALPAHILELFIKRDDLALDEIDVWNNLMSWAYAQAPTVNKDPSKWTKDELNLMEKMLSRFIPLIRFHDITSKEYYIKILPYQNLLPEKLRQELLQFYMVADKKQIGPFPSRFFGTIDSVIINAKHILLFARWMDNKEHLKGIPYKFKRIFRGSKDGFDESSFHKRCDNKGATIVTVKIKGKNQIVGGYDDPLSKSVKSKKKLLRLALDNENNDNQDSSFIFSFENHEDGGIIKAEKAIIHNKDRWGRNYYDSGDKLWGPLFGEFNIHSNDLTITMGDSFNWSPINIPRNFEIDDFEVFQVVKQD